jgi:hypothetical protein
VLHADGAASGWRGRVFDAHDGVALEGIELSIQRRGFEHVQTNARCTSGALGAFALPPIDAQPGDELVVEGSLHGVLRLPLPPRGELRVALVLRKRMLVDRLVAWARRRGSLLDVAPDPTPGDVRREAGAAPAVARWAEAVERAAYAGGIVDQKAHAAVDRLAPVDAVEGDAGHGRSPESETRQPKRRA